MRTWQVVLGACALAASVLFVFALNESLVRDEPGSVVRVDAVEAPPPVGGVAPEDVEDPSSEGVESVTPQTEVVQDDDDDDEDNDDDDDDNDDDDDDNDDG